MSKPDETTCKIVINSTLPDDKGTWRIIIEAEENKNNQNTYEYLHILDVQVYRKYMNVTSKYFFLLHRILCTLLAISKSLLCLKQQKDLATGQTMVHATQLVKTKHADLVFKRNQDDARMAAWISV